MEKENPKVFISHASEDKERFVLEFARKLRNEGVNAWYDNWEMYLGDSLVDKIFEEGIKEADFFIIVLSQKSINKDWVKEELNSAIIQRIEKSTKIIPVIIDENVEVPTSLNHHIWVKIPNLDDYNDKFNEIIMAIYGMDKKPPLGAKPKYAVNYNEIPGLNKTDSLVLYTLGKMMLDNNDSFTINRASEVFNALEKFNIPRDEIIESLEILKSKYLISLEYTLGNFDTNLVGLNAYGFVKYGENFMENFNEIYKSIVSAIFNRNININLEITSKLGLKEAIVDSILEYFHKMNYVEFAGHMGGMIQIDDITPSGKRYFRQVLGN